MIGGRAGRLAWLTVWLLATAAGQDATAAERRSVTLSDGTEMAFALALPDGFDAARSYPALIALPGGEQTIEGAVGLVERLWQTEASRRGYIVVSPAALWGGERPFIGDFADDTLLPQFIDAMHGQFHVETGRFHLAGFSAGAEAAFRVAVRHPELFRSLTALSGYAGDPADIARLPVLKGLPIAMFVGENDIYVAPGMERNRDVLEAAGIAVHYEVVAGSYHRLEALRRPEGQAHLFDQIAGPASR